MATNVKKIYAKELTGEELQKYEFLLQGEEVLMALKVQIGRDIFIATNKKLLFIDIQGITGKKVEYTIIPLTKINCFSVETAGTFDIDAEFKVWINGIGLREFELVPTLKEAYEKGRTGQDTASTRILQLAELLNKSVLGE